MRDSETESDCSNDRRACGVSCRACISSLLRRTGL
ncbi:hypothetical protein EVA_06802 [gut metagenome]|uniref:Uncharacterized protein n=1 Tax=gut metagenome TaxID=749906 RepID=J9GRE5_9ZZZZ